MEALDVAVDVGVDGKVEIIFDGSFGGRRRDRVLRGQMQFGIGSGNGIKENETKWERI